MKKDISIIIVTYNSENTIQGCVESIIQTVKRHAFEIIISDNSTNNNTENVIRDHFKNDVLYIHNKENLGFSKANNVGVRRANARYILFLNPDTMVYEDTIDAMTDFMKQHQDAGAATCFVKLPNGELDDSSHRGFPTPWNAFSHFSGLAKIFPKTKLFGGYNLTYIPFNNVHEIDSLAGSFMIVPYHVGEELHWWDEDYFFYGEDIDFCYRIKKAGYKIYFVPGVYALHMKGISSGIKKISKDVTRATKETKKFATYHRFKAMEIFYDKHYKGKYNSLLTGLVKLGIRLKKMTA